MTNKSVELYPDGLVVDGLPLFVDADDIKIEGPLDCPYPSVRARIICDTLTLHSGSVKELYDAYKEAKSEPEAPAEKPTTGNAEPAEAAPESVVPEGFIPIDALGYNVEDRDGTAFKIITSWPDLDGDYFAVREDDTSGRQEYLNIQSISRWLGR